MNLPSVSTEYVWVPVSAVNMQGGGAYDPTADIVQMAFLDSAKLEPGPGDWHSAVWGNPSVNNYLAGCLVGPAGLSLPVGKYYVWVQVTDDPEVPARPSGTLSII